MTLALAWICGIASAQTLDVHAVTALERPLTYQRLEWRVDPGKSYDNPFDPDQIAIDAKLNGPDGKAFVVPAFWNGPAGFIVRFCAPAAGTWTMSVEAKDDQGVRTS